MRGRGSAGLILLVPPASPIRLRPPSDFGGRPAGSAGLGQRFGGGFGQLGLFLGRNEFLILVIRFARLGQRRFLGGLAGDFGEGGQAMHDFIQPSCRMVIMRHGSRLPEFRRWWRAPGSIRGCHRRCKQFVDAHAAAMSGVGAFLAAPAVEHDDPFLVEFLLCHAEAH